MCEIISNQSKVDYTLCTKTVRLNGHVTSIRLENYFWNILYAVATAENVSIRELLCRLSDEFAELSGGPPKNFASLLRVGCVKFSIARPDVVSVSR